MAAADIQWLEGKPDAHFGTTFGHPWPRGRYFPKDALFSFSGASGIKIPLQTWITGYWPDGSIKWTAHAIPALSDIEEDYTVNVSVGEDASTPEPLNLEGFAALTVLQSSPEEPIEVNTGKIRVSFGTRGSSIIHIIRAPNGSVTGQNGRLVLLSQSSLPSDYTSNVTINEFFGVIQKVTVEQSGPVRAVIAIRGEHHCLIAERGSSRKPWLQFVLRFYLYSNSRAIRVKHTLVYDGNVNSDFIRGLGVRFDVPLENEHLYDRHIRISGASGGIFCEAVQGLTGLRRDPGATVREAQVGGKPAPSQGLWDASAISRLQWVPAWNDFSLSQLSPDNFTLKKRTIVGCSWVKIPSGTQAGGVVYLGGGTRGGLAVGLRNFWERYPTGIDIRNAASDIGEITTWLYSPLAPPMDMRQYHNGLGQETHIEQLDALNITYEDWEVGLGSAYGVARTNELYIFACEQTPEQITVAKLSDYTRQPPVLIPTSRIIKQTRVFGTSWSPSSPLDWLHLNSIKGKIKRNLDFLFRFYQAQIAQRHWYGFWDHGDVMHTYDEDRHCWRYDVGGYAWDNSELSPDLWLWLYFLQTGRADVYRMAEALTSHTGEVDVYHIGKFKGLGTRHGVQHWSDSCKQARISNALYRKYFYFLSGGDERVGELLQEVLDTEKTFLTLDPYRKVRKDKATYKPDTNAFSISLGTDWAALAAAWIVEIERKGPRWEEAQTKLCASTQGIGNLHNGFVTGIATYNMHTGEISALPQDPDNKGFVQISHLSAMFGLVEVCAELMENNSGLQMAGFEKAWLEYCYHFNGTSEEQTARFGVAFGKLQLRQGHSRLTAYAAWKLGDKNLARRAWQEFFLEGEYGPEDGYGPDTLWKVKRVTGEDVLQPVDEAAWVSTNITALYGIAAIQNLALVGDELAA